MVLVVDAPGGVGSGGGKAATRKGRNLGGTREGTGTGLETTTAETEKNTVQNGERYRAVLIPPIS